MNSWREKITSKVFFECPNCHMPQYETFFVTETEKCVKLSCCNKSFIVKAKWSANLDSVIEIVENEPEKSYVVFVYRGGMPDKVKVFNKMNKSESYVKFLLENEFAKNEIFRMVCDIE